MDTIGRNLLIEFWQRCPQAERDLRVLYAILSAASWEGPGEAQRQFGPAARVRDGGRLVVACTAAACQVTLRVGYDRQMVQIELVEPLVAGRQVVKEEPSHERHQTDPVGPGPRRRPA